MRPDSGEIEIGGKRWRWLTVGRVRGERRSARRPGISWSVAFRAVDRPEKSFWYDIPDTQEPPTDEALREAFRKALGGSEEG